MSGRAAKQLATRLLEPGELLSEDEACVRLHPAFPPLWETAQTHLSKKYFRTRERLRNVFTGPLATQTLLVQTPLGLGVPWRLWGESLEIVPALLQANGSILLQGWSEGANSGSSDLWNVWKTGQIPAGVVHVPADQTTKCEFITDRILTELPPWSR
ncbi:MAG TPA: hypothetical protein VFV38_53105 [Ktedonobacteraceae bacterium]|nr:hypothetical protein [Ktedonobacteraceae bacterium]